MLPRRAGRPSLASMLLCINIIILNQLYLYHADYLGATWALLWDYLMTRWGLRETHRWTKGNTFRPITYYRFKTNDRTYLCAYMSFFETNLENFLECLAASGCFRIRFLRISQHLATTDFLLFVLSLQELPSNKNWDITPKFGKALSFYIYLL